MHMKNTENTSKSRDVVKNVSFVVVPLKHAQEVKEFLVKNTLLHHDFAVKKDQKTISFPIISGEEKIKSKFSFVTIAQVSEKEKDQNQKKGTLKDALTNVLSKQELLLLRRAYDVVGSIAILEVPKELTEKQELLASAILQSHKNIQTVLKKAGAHEGEFRTQKMEFLAGIDTRETVHVESGVRLKLDVEKVYYSIRMGTERLRIAQQVKEGELILVMFSGCGPYSLILGKRTKAKEIVGIEINPLGHKYAVENVALNKVKNVTCLQGDVRKIVEKLEKRFDRILMPLPKSAGEFLDCALRVAHKGTIIHLYDFLREDEFFKVHDKIKQACEEKKVLYKIVRTVKCGQHAPHMFRVCVDVVIEKI